jgi:hypothetical protein
MPGSYPGRQKIRPGVGGNGGRELFDVEVGQRGALELRVADTDSVERDVEPTHLLDSRCKVPFDCGFIERIDLRSLRRVADLVCNGLYSGESATRQEDLCALAGKSFRDGAANGTTATINNRVLVL